MTKRCNTIIIRPAGKTSFHVEIENPKADVDRLVVCRDIDDVLDEVREILKAGDSL